MIVDTVCVEVGWIALERVTRIIVSTNVGEGLVRVDDDVWVGDGKAVLEVVTDLTGVLKDEDHCPPAAIQAFSPPHQL